MLCPGGFFFSSTIAGLPREGPLVQSVDPVRRVNPSETRYFGDAEDILGEIRTAGFAILAPSNMYDTSETAGKLNQSSGN